MLKRLTNNKMSIDACAWIIDANRLPVDFERANNGLTPDRSLSTNV